MKMYVIQRKSKIAINVSASANYWMIGLFVKKVTRVILAHVIVRLTEYVKLTSICVLNIIHKVNNCLENIMKYGIKLTAFLIDNLIMNPFVIINI